MTTLTIEDLSLHYGRHQVLRNVMLPEIPAGSIVGVLGPNGAGKTTLLRALAGLCSFDGRVLLKGESLTAMPQAQRARLIAYLPQALPQATTLIGYEAVVSAHRAVRSDLPKAEIEAAAERVFDTLAISDLAFRPLSRMSGGQRQMIGLAQVIVREPQVLLLDEPTSALDLRRQIEVLSAAKGIVKQRRGICFLALHDINLALRHCDSIALLAEQRLRAFGPPDRIMTREILRDLYRVEGRVERCSMGLPFVITDGAPPGDESIRRLGQ